jgi:putative transposase
LIVHVPKRATYSSIEIYAECKCSDSQVDKTIAYISGQEKHHRRKTFEEEFLAFLKKHGTQYDERYVFG